MTHNFKNFNPNQFQVAIMYSPVSLPLFIGSHPWFVINDCGNFSRYEVLHIRSHNPEHVHVFCNFLPPFVGLPIIWGIKKWFWRAHTLQVLSGGDAQKLAYVLQTSLQNYPYKYYRFLGPNSNTYAQWVLDTAGLSHIKLPWNAVGTNFKK